eukprot:TRINITY_DN6458_c0_g2_i1.p1 TRINITY_DN6458_c0_g2~~TRINITY_DN6458_c0_g2_i1.p1  ORF type:complete len:277 (-),score=64.73 TRINITY_DN6458_c0_g2_i1:412-1242(-)
MGVDEQVVKMALAEGREEHSVEGSNPKAEKSSSYGFKAGEWTFDEKVAANWNNELRGHIPSYFLTIKLVANMTKQLHGVNVPVLSFWCGNGNQFHEYLELGWEANNLVGINYSVPHANMCRDRFPDIKQHMGDEATRPFDPRQAGKFTVVQMLYAVQFEHPDKRRRLLEQAFECVEPGGTLFLTEKCKQSEIMEDMYYHWKASQGVDWEVIHAKKKALVGRMWSVPFEWYVEVLKEIGFLEVEILHAHFGFVSFMARKPRSSNKRQRTEEAGGEAK